MKRTIITAAVIALLVGLMSMAGCGEKKTIETPEGKVEVSEGEGGEVTYRTEEGEAKFKPPTEAPSEEEIGAPIYPGAVFNKEGSGTVSGTSAEGEYTAVVAEYSTRDGFDAVKSFYEKKLGEPAFYESARKEASWTKIEGGFIIAVSVAQGEGDVRIIISKTQTPLSP